jgi:hypothetical protein
MDTSTSLDDLIANLSIRNSESQDPLSPTDDRIRALRARRNALTPLCRVPADVLVQILELLQLPATEEELEDTISNNGSEDIHADWKKENVDKDREYEEWYGSDLSDDENAYHDARNSQEDEEDNWEDNDYGSSGVNTDDDSDHDSASDSDARDHEDADGAEHVTSHEHVSPTPCRQYPKDLTRIASTCSHIRAIALTSPSLWSCLFFPSPSDLVALWLERAQSYPLILIFNERNHRPEDIPGYELVKPAMCRARHVAVENERLGVAPPINSKVIQSVLDEPMSALVSLVIRAYGLDVALTPRFLGACARTLTSLVLIKVQLPWDAVDLVVLTHLEVEADPGTLALARVLGFLSRLAALKSLTLTCLKFESLEPLEALPDFALPHLERLKLCQYMRALDVLSAALPAPRVRYELLSLTAPFDQSSPTITTARTRVFARVQRFADSNNADVCLFHDGFSLYMRVEARGAACTRAVLLDRADDVADLACHLAGVRRLSVRGSAARALFEYAAEHLANALANLEHLTIEGWAPTGLESEALLTWLTARAEDARGAHRARVRVLDFRGRGAYPERAEFALSVQLLDLVDSPVEWPSARL